MEIAYLHLVTNHIPIIGVPFALFLLVMGMWRRSDEIKAISFLVFTLLGFVTIAVYLLGQGGEDFVEELAGVSHDAIEAHEDIARIALGSTILLGAIAVFALVRYKGFALLKPRWGTKAPTTDAESTATLTGVFPAWITIAVLLAALLSAGVLGFTGRLGGQIRHTEFTDGAANMDQGDRERDGDRGWGRNRGGR